MTEVVREGTIKSLEHTEVGGVDTYSFVLKWTVVDDPGPPPETHEETWTYNDVDEKWYDDAMGAGTSAVKIVTDGSPPEITAFGITR